MNISSLDNLLSEAVARGDVPGVSAIAIDRNGVTYEGAAGNARAGLAMAPDTVVRIASMTKALTSLCALQLVDRGLLSLDRPASDIVPELGEVQVLQRDGSLRPPVRAVTLRGLLTHTAGFGYAFTDPLMDAYMKAQAPNNPGMHVPLVCDPGTRWQYGISTDWVGVLVEQASGRNLGEYMEAEVLTPLGMADTGFLVAPRLESRLAAIHLRGEDGAWTEFPGATDLRSTFRGAKVDSGGGGLTSTAPDYARFLAFMLGEGSASGSRVIGAESFAGLTTNQIGSLVAGKWKSEAPKQSNDIDLTAGGTTRHSLGFLLSKRDSPTGAASGTLSWAGIFNSYYWIDRARGVAGATFSQFFPFMDAAAWKLHEDFQSAVYAPAA